ncbi:hypothetical protein TRIATDRAFT_53809 [Trichoderma atroviride IMI 206040]|uniref:NACHT domain-containing protein n=1 Tax=Hypocrea atroviridis (strain ATCC 20476 / IMI 206040) TaxID=452589 RepID=G9NL98_HYPAI|nr:uncharacterized protein TRIATDRAFT_53809 [Trichoderma atroviride IMI 206040]EHK48663.1 hypothetical protein TRIATDRAFT_53809 [Trichoderma atroviride IMI 206040]
MADPHNRSCLKALRTTDPREHKERIEKSSGGLFLDSCSWILDNAEFKQWYSHPRSNLLWIKGNPGKGKTMLLCSIIDGMSSTAEPNNQDACTPSYFFCQASDLRTNNATAVLRGLIYMIVDRQPILVSHARNRYDRAGDQILTDSNSWETLSKIFSAIVQDRRLIDSYIIIDALDQCTTDRDLLIGLIARLSAATSKIKWLVSSRNMSDIEEDFTMVHKLEISLELNDRSISQAVGLYTWHKVGELAKAKGYSDELQNAVYRHICLNARSSFLWVALVCQDIANIPTQSCILSRLAGFPTELNALYACMLYQVCGLGVSKLCLQILAIVSVVYRPITTDELSSLVDMPDGALDEETLAQALEICSSFLTIHQRTIFFVHPSAKDFLIGKATNTVFAPGMEHIHYTIFSQSLQVLQKSLRRDIYGLNAPGFPIDQVKQPDPDPLAAARYPCVYWARHLIDSVKLVKQHGHLHDGVKVDVFLRTKFLYWLESLSLLGSLPEGALSISRLHHVLRQKANPQLADLVRDAHIFITHHMAPIQSSPLQVYASALVFNPANFLVKNLFSHEEPGWIVPKPRAGDKERMPGGVQTLKAISEQIDSMVFSPDGTLLASVSIDGAVQIWNLETGRCTQTLHVHPASVYSVTFRPNSSNLIISGREDDSIHVWDTSTNQMLQTLKGHGDAICAIVFSPNNNDLLASGSWDQTVRIWDLAASSCVQTLNGHDGDVCTIAFSPDGVRLASGSSDCTIKIWDPVNGLCLQTLHRYNVVSTAIIFTPDGTKLVSALNRDSVAIWDVATGQCLHTAFVGAPLRQLRFDMTGSCLHTDRGTISVDFVSSRAASLEPYMRGYWISADNRWIKENSEKLLWLPSDYRACTALIRISSMSLVALGSSSGRIAILRLLDSSDTIS